MKSFMRALTIIFFCSSLSVFAQQNDGGKQETEDAGTQFLLWEASLPGGSYVVALKCITAVSRHRYLLDATIIVDEITIDTIGTTTARFYHLSPVGENGELDLPNALTERGRELLGQAGRRAAGADLGEMVQKTYPVTTHAKSIEYRLTSEKQLMSLFSSINKSWRTGRGRKFTIKKTD